MRANKCRINANRINSLTFKPVLVRKGYSQLDVINEYTVLFDKFDESVFFTASSMNIKVIFKKKLAWYTVILIFNPKIKKASLNA